MTTGVGLTVGDSVSTAVVTASGTDVRTIEHPSVLFTAPDGTVAEARRRRVDGTVADENDVLRCRISCTALISDCARSVALLVT